jgi:hypothetical protein
MVNWLEGCTPIVHLSLYFYLNYLLDKQSTRFLFFISNGINIQHHPTTLLPAFVRLALLMDGENELEVEMVGLDYDWTEIMLILSFNKRVRLPALLATEYKPTGPTRD